MTRDDRLLLLAALVVGVVVLVLGSISVSALASHGSLIECVKAKPVYTIEPWEDIDNRQEFITVLELTPPCYLK